ncbi:MAG TPA: C4-type zinc ribbon domain-containing protein, partial [Negativicutes bacterium]|nr:C4-type zinc ribbon domain-containing protein [Negativicutes bacterium]
TLASACAEGLTKAKFSNRQYREEGKAMKNQLGVLCQLQVLEQQKRAAGGRKEKISVEEVRLLWQDVRQLTQGLAADREKLAALEKTCADCEKELTALTRQCQDFEKKLYGGEITNVKEIEQVRTRCESLRCEIGQRENDAVAALEDCERLTAKIAGDEASLHEKKRLHAEKQQLVTQEAARSDAELAGLEERCRALTAKLDPAILRLFRELARKLPQPVARVTDGICGGCRRSLPTNQIVKAKEKIMYCDNCGRILFVE